MVSLAVDSFPGVDYICIEEMVMANTRKVDREKVRKLYVEDGLSTIEIGKLLGCSPFSIKSNLHAAGVKMRGCGGRRTEKTLGFVPTKDFMVAAMKHFNNVASDAAKHYGINYSSWIDWLERFEIPRASPGTVLRGRPSHKRHEIDVQDAVAMSDSGATYQEIADKYKVSYGVVVRRMREIGHSAPWRRTKDDRFRTHSWHKRQVLKQLGITSCEICGETRALDFCHIKPDAEDGAVAKENALVLCKTHHDCYDKGLLTREEFIRVRDKIRSAEALYLWANPFYGGW